MPDGSNVIIIDILRVFLQIDLFLGREHFPAVGGITNLLELWAPWLSWARVWQKNYLLTCKTHHYPPGPYPILLCHKDLGILHTK